MTTVSYNISGNCPAAERRLTGSIIKKPAEDGANVVELPTYLAGNVLAQVTVPPELGAASVFNLVFNYQTATNDELAYSLDYAGDGKAVVTGPTIQLPIPIIASPGSAVGLARINNGIYITTNGLAVAQLAPPASSPNIKVLVNKASNSPLLDFKVGTAIGNTTLSALVTNSIYIAEIVDPLYTVEIQGTCVKSTDTGQNVIEPLLECVGGVKCLEYVERPATVVISALSCTSRLPLCANTISTLVDSDNPGNTHFVITTSNKGYISVPITGLSSSILQNYSYGCGVGYVSVGSNTDIKAHLDNRKRDGNVADVIFIKDTGNGVTLEWYKNTNGIDSIIFTTTLLTKDYLESQYIKQDCDREPATPCGKKEVESRCRVSVISKEQSVSEASYQVPLGERFIYSQGLGSELDLTFSDNLVGGTEIIRIRKIGTGIEVLLPTISASYIKIMTLSATDILRITRTKYALAIYVGNFLIYRMVFSPSNSTPLYMKQAIGVTSDKIINNPRLNGVALSNWSPSNKLEVEKYHCGEVVAVTAQRQVKLATVTPGKLNLLRTSEHFDIEFSSKKEIFKIHPDSIECFLYINIQNRSVIPSMMRLYVSKSRNPTEQEAVTVMMTVPAKASFVSSHRVVLVKGERLILTTSEAAHATIASIQDGDYTQ